jgi:hypothetical protein
MRPGDVNANVEVFSVILGYLFYVIFRKKIFLKAKSKFPFYFDGCSLNGIFSHYPYL